jgi:hypothetical protein
LFIAFDRGVVTEALARWKCRAAGHACSAACSRSSFEPKSVNSRGSIVGVVHRANGTTSGLLFAKSFRCDISPIVTQ